LVDGGKNYRTYLYIDDATRAIKLILDNQNGLFNNEIINIGAPNNETRIEDLANLMIDLYQNITGKNFEHGVENVDNLDFYGEGYEDCDRRIPDISKLEKVGWVPKYNLKETFRQTLDYYFKNYNPLN
jgi:UDP-apiose/xylose synthase